ncbi:hypothetical protein GQ55_1G378300 [Panicum hallii var. hallii]|uniref:Uncharacterized protein n=1 Tax=Panicum hallii var. hallii TaxID=1504633 RepID=A0A2T7FBS7_9POAL|nr:hypothetical protein GQ55_1G378300 [Panicum hallii var. hallii]
MAITATTVPRPPPPRPFSSFPSYIKHTPEPHAPFFQFPPRSTPPLEALPHESFESRRRRSVAPLLLLDDQPPPKFPHMTTCRSRKDMSRSTKKSFNSLARKKRTLK